MMKKVQARVLIFDFDGVIVNSGADIANAVQYAQRVFHATVLPREEIIGYVGDGMEKLIYRSFQGCSEEIIRQAVPVYKKYYLEHCIDETVLYPHVAEVLEHYRDRRIALVTNKPEDLTKKIIAELNVAQYFHMVVGPASVTHLKPHPEGIEKVLDAFGEKSENTVMIGDSYTDIQAGRSAGTYTCAAVYGLGDREQVLAENPDWVVEDLIELLQWVE